ncbi:hypothetical protein Patl1_16273 [Pistacia atlantica]|uniref:Uncharacterized protein n=1 Tax=Pistacia atlantica TaxID=434234 RepID=A0ACC1B9D9_9ROSI|nr:hypothetical protein Patl1_16273 [Pistacia atlantica]
MTKMARRNKKKSLCEESMKLVVSIVKLSSLSLATWSLRTPVILPAAAERNQVPAAASGKIAAIMDVRPMAQLPAGTRSQNSQEQDINRKATDFIRRIREKNKNVPTKESKDFPYVMPPPPPLTI